MSSPNPNYSQTIQKVSGNNNIKIQNKNLFDGELELGQYNGTTGEKLSNDSLYRNKNRIPVKPSTTYNFSINGVNQNYVILEYKSNGDFIGQTNLNTSTFTTSSNTYFINFRCKSADFTSDYANLKVQLEYGSTVTSYTAHIDQNLSVDLMSKNIFDGEIELGSINPGNGNLVDSTTRTRSKNYIKVKPNTTYTFTRKVGQFRWIVGYTANKTGILDGNAGGQTSALLQIGEYDKLGTFTTSSTTEYIKWYDTSCTNLTEQVQIEKRKYSNRLRTILELRIK